MRNLWKLPVLSPIPKGLGCVFTPDIAHFKPTEIVVPPEGVDIIDLPTHSSHWMVVPTQQISLPLFRSYLLEFGNPKNWKGPEDNWQFGSLNIPPKHITAGHGGLVMAALYWFTTEYYEAIAVSYTHLTLPTT
eukprot:TRINITY_DN11002_c0_g1_i1.p1 TRINITY_DN11002_c0_g1~~TRINITY_DN11002_c0_g1_i1.p1  ORF type:complete len:133 (+),score=24.73 TRINITY_DN11002_c0_g1_i1:412-810(+)